VSFVVKKEFDFGWSSAALRNLRRIGFSIMAITAIMAI
jgi:hypothetical protein